jgi:hypothetical protein
MKKFEVRPLNPDKEGQLYIDWLKMADILQNNLVDFGVYSYPSIINLTVTADEQPVLMNSVHPVCMMEALAPQPGIAPRDEAMALRRLLEGVRNLAKNYGMGEIWFTCVDPTLHKFIEKKGFKLVSTPVYKLVIDSDSDPLKEARPEGHKN